MTATACPEGEEVKFSECQHLWDSQILLVYCASEHTFCPYRLSVRHKCKAWCNVPPCSFQVYTAKSLYCNKRQGSSYSGGGRYIAAGSLTKRAFK